MVDPNLPSYEGWAGSVQHCPRWCGAHRPHPATSWLTRVTKSYQKLPFGSGDYPDKLLFHQALNWVSNSSDREQPRNMFRFKTDYNYLGGFVLSLTRVTKRYLLALGTTQISSHFTKHWTKFLTHQTGNYPVTCFVSKPSRVTLVELYHEHELPKVTFWLIPGTYNM